jgi:transposase
LLTRRGVGPHNAAALLITAGDNPDRLRSEASFAALCGVNPLDASSGKTSRRRLNRGGDRQTNSALYRIAICRLRCDARTRDYLTRRITEGKTRREAIRCLIGELSGAAARRSSRGSLGGARGWPRCRATSMASLSTATPGIPRP